MHDFPVTWGHSSASSCLRGEGTWGGLWRQLPLSKATQSSTELRSHFRDACLWDTREMILQRSLDHLHHSPRPPQSKMSSGFVRSEISSTHAQGKPPTSATSAPDEADTPRHRWLAELGFSSVTAPPAGPSRRVKNRPPPISGVARPLVPVEGNAQRCQGLLQVRSTPGDRASLM